MELEVLASTPSPDELAAVAARNDYSHGWVGEQSFSGLMEEIDADDGLEDRHRRQVKRLGKMTSDDDSVPDQTELESIVESLLNADSVEEKAEVLVEFIENRNGGEDDENLSTYALNQLQHDTMEAKKRSLLTHLMNNGHYGPFEHPTITVSIKGVSRSCMAQLTRHRMASFDVQSMRYVNFGDIDPKQVSNGEWVVVPPSATDPDWIGRNQDGGTVDEETAKKREEVFRSSVEDSFEDYRELVELGMPPEDARFVLPIGWKTNIVMSLNARHLMHVADMRAAGDAQWEVRELTNEILEAAREWAPVTFNLYDEILRDRKNRLAP